MIFPPAARTISARAEVHVRLLLLQPAQEFLVARIGQNFFDSVEFVAELVVCPGFVNEIFAGAAGRNDFAAAFATRHNVMAAGGDVAFAEFALLGIGHTFAVFKIHKNGARGPDTSGHRTGDPLGVVPLLLGYTS
jgi:hypothetical protein